MQTEPGRLLSELTTLRVGGPAREYVNATTSNEIIEAVRDADSVGIEVLVVAGGSNLLVADSGFDGRVVHVRSRGISLVPEGDIALVEVQAGESWDDLVVQTTAEGLSGFECLSGIPGSVGATPVQNVGAYGEEVSTSFVSLTALDRSDGEVVVIGPEECAFGYRTSVFKRNDRFVILSVTFRLAFSSMSAPVKYAELARRLDVEPGESVPSHQAREAVLALRRSKGMVLDSSDPDTRSAGSFFTNPIVDRDLLERVPLVPHWPGAGGKIKVSAAWLIENAGFERGHTRGRVRLSTKHTLALTNFDNGTAADVMALAREVQSGVFDAFGVVLHPEPVLVGADF